MPCIHAVTMRLDTMLNAKYIHKDALIGQAFLRVKPVNRTFELLGPGTVKDTNFKAMILSEEPAKNAPTTDHKPMKADMLRAHLETGDRNNGWVSVLLFATGNGGKHKVAVVALAGRNKEPSETKALHASFFPKPVNVGAGQNAGGITSKVRRVLPTKPHGSQPPRQISRNRNVYVPPFGQTPGGESSQGQLPLRPQARSFQPVSKGKATASTLNPAASSFSFAPASKSFQPATSFTPSENTRGRPPFQAPPDPQSRPPSQSPGGGIRLTDSQKPSPVNTPARIGSPASGYRTPRHNSPSGLGTPASSSKSASGTVPKSMPAIMPPLMSLKVAPTLSRFFKDGKAKE